MPRQGMKGTATSDRLPGDDDREEGGLPDSGRDDEDEEPYNSFSPSVKQFSAPRQVSQCRGILVCWRPCVCVSLFSDQALKNLGWNTLRGDCQLMGGYPPLCLCATVRPRHQVSDTKCFVFCG